jgi:hypothetical protein
MNVILVLILFVIWAVWHIRSSSARIQLPDRAPLLVLCGLMALMSCNRMGAATRELEIRGAVVVVNATAPFTRHADFRARLESTIDVALQYWGGTWAALDGKTITFASDRHVRCEGSTAAMGCYDGSIRVSTRDVATVFNCVEETVLVHEIGHAVIGDPQHTDPRWRDFGAVQRRLEGRPGYDERGETSCVVHVSVWRHPPQ